jgi:alpha-maltose-1-phosphate synthase
VPAPAPSSRRTVALLSREYPPEIYGGAGVHVEYLTRELTRHVDVRVHCFGAPRSAPEVAASYEPWSKLDGPDAYLAALRTLSVNLCMTAGLQGAALVHSHTWYANFAGRLGQLVHGIPHVMTTHSLEPLRPWKREQLGGGYGLSSFCEQNAIESADGIIAVSQGMKADILRVYPAVHAERVHVIHNGIDPDEYRPDPGTDVLQRRGIDPQKPYVVFVGRMTRQKGVVHLLEAAEHFVPELNVVLCAGEPDTPEMVAEVTTLVSALERTRGGVIWIPEMMQRPELIQILSHARAFVCPSVYEPFGIVNLEAMACGVPVVASAVGGIPEIVVEGVTGRLVPLESDGSPHAAPKDRAAFARSLAERLNELARDPALAARMGMAGRERVVEHFSWRSIAEKTAALYQRLILV